MAVESFSAALRKKKTHEPKPVGQSFLCFQGYGSMAAP